MTTIFIPLLFICINGNCEFQQSTTYFKEEIQCEEDLERQKKHMRDLLKMARQGKIELMEGTCVDLKVNIIKSNNTSFKE